MMKLNSMFKTTLAVGIGITTLHFSSAFGVEEFTLEEIVVTARKRTESLQDVPVSVSSVSAEKLKDAGITDVSSLQGFVPNLNMSESGQGTTINIRGIGSGINAGFEQSVGMYLDGIYYGRAQLVRSSFLDLERVEVLRGPQGILFGKNSIAGAVSMISAKPTEAFESSLGVLYEPKYNDREITAVVSGPISDNIAGRLAIRKKDTDGYLENIYTKEDEPSRDEAAARASVTWDVSENLKLGIKLETGSFDVKGRHSEVIDSAASTSPTPGFTGLTQAEILAFSFGQPAVDLNPTQDYKRSGLGDASNNDVEAFAFDADYQVENGTFTLTSGYVGYNYDEQLDADFTAANILAVTQKEDFRQRSFELRFASDFGTGFEYIAGVFYQSNELDYELRNIIDSNSIFPALLSAQAGASAAAAGAPPAEVTAARLAPLSLSGTSLFREFSQTTDTSAVFAQATWDVTEKLKVSLGGRFTIEEKHGERVVDTQSADGGEISTALFDITGDGIGDVPTDILTTAVAATLKTESHDLEADRRESKFTPLVNVQYYLNSDTMIYGSWTKGFKSGGFDSLGNASSGFEFEEEEANSFELGSKLTLAGGEAEINVALYRTEYENLQVSVYDGFLGFNIGNAGKAITQGVELDGRWRVSQGLTLTGALAYSDFKFDKYPNGQCFHGETPTRVVPDPAFSDQTLSYCDRKGATNQYVSDWTASLTADYTTEITAGIDFRATLDLLYSDDYITSQNLDPRITQDAFVKVNLRLALIESTDRWELALLGKNLTDEAVVGYANEVPLSGSVFGSFSHYGFVEPPRTIALQGVLHF